MPIDSEPDQRLSSESTATNANAIQSVVNTYVENLKRVWKELEPRAASVWLFYYLSAILALGLAATIIGNLVLLFPWAGFLMILVKLKQEQKEPRFQEILTQFDHFVPMLVLSIIYVCVLMGFCILAIFVRAIPFLGLIFSPFLFLLFFSTAFPILIYSMLLICHQRESAIDALSNSINVFRRDFGNQFILGLGLFILSLPCGLGAPLGFYLLVEEYFKRFPKRAGA